LINRTEQDARVTNSQALSPGLIRAFQRFVIACGSLNLALFAWGFFEADFVSGEVSYALALGGYDAIVSLPSSVWWLLLAIYSGACLGMCRFWRPARTAFAVMCGLLMVSPLLSGLAVITPLSGFFGSIWATLQGVILALAYAPPLAQKFRPKLNVVGSE
jgi:hypothetical protein